MSQFGDTVSISQLTTLAAAMRTAGYRGMNNLSLLQLTVDAADPTVLLRAFLTNDGLHPPGTEQVETATVVGTVTVAGNIVWTINASALPFGLPHDVEVAVEVGDNASTVARKSAYTLSRDQILAEVFRTIESSGANVIFRAWCAANDGTMNAAYAEGTSDGLTAAATSANTTAGNTTPINDGIVIEAGESNNLIAGSGLPGQVLDAGLIWLFPELVAGGGPATTITRIVAVGG